MRLFSITVEKRSPPSEDGPFIEVDVQNWNEALRTVQRWAVDMANNLLAEQLDRGPEISKTLWVYIWYFGTQQYPEPGRQIGKVRLGWERPSD